MEIVLQEGVILKSNEREFRFSKAKKCPSKGVSIRNWIELIRH